MKGLSMVKRVAVATVAAAALVGPVTAAHAVLIPENQGDAILAVYGNTTEYVRNLGSYQDLITNGLNLDLSSIMSQVSAGGAQVKYTLFGSTYLPAAESFFGSKFALSEWTSADNLNFDDTVLPQVLVVWGGQLANAGQTADPTFFNKFDPLSFSTNLNNSGNDTLAGTTPADKPGYANLGETLYLMTKSSPISQVGIATLSANGQMQIGQVAAVPVPAAAILFASGLVGLVGLARRRMSGTSQDAA
ncbi:MAG: hypothetical protein L0H94_02895 [Nitrospira sp.]|nr:hypothetical protein [Nitrospira sp.]